MSVNKVILVGRLGKDPEVRYAQSGTAVTNFTMATTRTYKKENERVDETEWHKIVAFGRTGEICGEYLNKGSQVYIEGRIQTREWEDKDGNRRWTTEVITERMQMLGSREDRGRDASSANASRKNAGEGPPPPSDDDPFNTPSEDDVPF
jgi:single-strand DNA-binding protein